MTRKIVSEMTYNVSSGTLNTTIPYRSVSEIKRDIGRIITIFHTPPPFDAPVKGNSVEISP